MREWQIDDGEFAPGDFKVRESDRLPTVNRTLLLPCLPHVVCNRPLPLRRCISII